MRPSVRVTVALLVAAIAGSTAQGERAQPPERLTIGYENEGKIDASPQA